MGKSKIFENEIYVDCVDKSNWQTVLEDNIENEEYKKLYLRRKKAIDMYFDNVKISKIVEETGFHRNTIRKFAKRCLMIDEKNGLPFGYVALIPYKRIQKYKRIDDKKEKCTGKFNQLLSEYTVLKDFIDNTYLKL